MARPFCRRDFCARRIGSQRGKIMRQDVRTRPASHLLRWVDLTLIRQCAVERRRFSAGAIPARQLLLQSVATGAVMEETKSSKPLV